MASGERRVRDTRGTIVVALGQRGKWNRESETTENLERCLFIQSPDTYVGVSLPAARRLHKAIGQVLKEAEDKAHG